MVLVICKTFFFFLFLLLFEECPYFLPYATLVVNKQGLNQQPMIHDL